MDDVGQKDGKRVDDDGWRDSEMVEVVAWSYFKLASWLMIQ